jgi:hypothetical protein
VNLNMEKLQFDEFGNPYFLSGLDRHHLDKKLLPEQTSIPHVKELTVQVVLVREGYTSDMRVKKWHGLVSYQIRVPPEKQFRHYYLVYDKKRMDSICVKILSPSKSPTGNYEMFTYGLTLNPSKESMEYDWFKRIGKPKQITAQKVAQLLQDKEILAVLDDSGSELIT